jgi:hypothetical protein
MAIVKKEQVIDNWSILIKSAQGRAEEIFNNTNNFILQIKVPIM